MSKPIPYSVDGANATKTFYELGASGMPSLKKTRLKSVPVNSELAPHSAHKQKSPCSQHTGLKAHGLSAFKSPLGHCLSLPHDHAGLDVRSQSGSIIGIVPSSGIREGWDGAKHSIMHSIMSSSGWEGGRRGAEPNIP